MTVSLGYSDTTRKIPDKSLKASFQTEAESYVLMVQRIILGYIFFDFTDLIDLTT
jgi:hypothetical protein